MKKLIFSLAIIMAFQFANAQDADRRARLEKHLYFLASDSLHGRDAGSEDGVKARAYTGFGVPFAVWPDRADVPRNAARSLRYMDDYILVRQGEVFYVTELLSKLEGMERGPAGNTSLTGAVTLAREMDEDQIIVVQETEYTGAGKHHNSQLSFARQMGIEVRRGDPTEGVNGKSIVIPEHLIQVTGHKQDMQKLSP